MRRFIKSFVAIMTASILTVNAMTISVFAEETATPTDAGNGTISIEDYCYGGVLPIPQIDTTTYDITQVVVEYKNRDADDESYSLEQPTQIGEYTARATFAANDNYGEFTAYCDFEITYLEAPDEAYKIEADYINEKEHKVWVKEGNTALIIPETGFAIAEELDGYYAENVAVTEALEANSKKIFLQNIGTGEKTDAIDVQEAFDKDGVAPTGSITIKDENDTFFGKFLNFITFGLFFKEKKVAYVDAQDDESGLAKVSYCLTTELLFDEGVIYTTDEMEQKIAEKGLGWNIYENGVDLDKDNIYIVYAKIEDNVGNVTYVNTEGIVVYSDAEIALTDLTYARGTATDTEIISNLNGNTIKSIVNGSVELIENDEYTIKDEKLVLNAAYLNSLEVGEYTITVTFNPGGVEAEAALPDEPDTATINVKCTRRNDGYAKLIVDDAYYGGAAPVVQIKSGSYNTSKAVVEYKNMTSDDSAYTTVVPTSVGDYTARVIFKENESFAEIAVTDDFSIKYLPVPENPYTIEGDAGDNGYYTSDVVIRPCSGYLISNELDGDYRDHLTVGESNEQAIIYLQKESTKEKTDGIQVKEIKIDKELAEVDGLRNGETYYGEYVEFLIDTQDISQVLVNEGEVSLQNGNILRLESRHGVEPYVIKLVDKAGHNNVYSIKVAAEWTKTNHIPAETTVRLQPGYVYHLDSGIWWIDGDTTEYKGYYKLHVDTEGEYIFHNRK